MSLVPGVRLGSYEITAKLGEGGMGEVWRATDLAERLESGPLSLTESIAVSLQIAHALEEALTLVSIDQNRSDLLLIDGLPGVTR